MVLYTIGFTQKNAQKFFTLLERPGLARLVDVRLNNQSQLAGFTKRDDLKFFARRICDLDYVHLPELAPTAEVMEGFKKGRVPWEVFRAQFTALLDQRRVADTLDRALFDGGCLLCSEAQPDHCHRRLVAEYLRSHWGDIEIRHL